MPNPFMTAGNWVGGWGARPANFGHQTPYSYFQQNQGQLANYWSNPRLGGYLHQYFNNPFQPQTPNPPNPNLGATGYVGTQPPSDGYTGSTFMDLPGGYDPRPPKGGFTPPPTGNGFDTWMGRSNGKYNPQPVQPPQNPNLGQQDWRFGGSLPLTPKFPVQPGIGGFRNQGWF